MRAIRRLKKGERGQTLILFVGIITVIFVMAAVVIDIGLWLAERRSVQRAVDLAAAAGAQDLLVSDSDAIAAGYEWAEKNGYVDDPANLVDVDVKLLCYNHLDNPQAICPNSNPVGPTPCPPPPPDSHCDSLRVTIKKPSTMLFSSIFGVDLFAISASSVAGLTVQSVPTDTVLLLDATGSMATSPCNAELTNAGCRMKEARDAANGFVDILLGGLNTASRIGFAAYNHCYDPPLGFLECMETSVSVVNVTGNASSLHSAINATEPASWADGECEQPLPPYCGGTNVCIGLDKAAFLLGGSTAERKNVVLLTDGEGRLFMPDPNYPPAVCRPPGGININSPRCNITEANEAALDVKTYQRAQALKAQGADIFVVGLQVCGTDNGLAPNCALVGNADSDTIADRRLLKCIASSPSHYVDISSASEIPDAFRELAGSLISRGLLE